MFTLPEVFYDINIISTTFRLVLAVIFGGIIGLERGANRHPAGFRTHILVCAGAALVMLTNQYICQMYDLADPARLGAQVITGVGFLGAGTIMVTGRSKVKGLTTAAGLWASACLGLALGIGFYSGAIIAALLIFISLALLPKVENYVYRRCRTLDLYIEIDSAEHFRDCIQYVRSLSPKSFKTQISGEGAGVPGGVSFQLTMDLSKENNREEIIKTLENFDGVWLAEEL